jgi:hypothetical protein
MKTHAMQNVSRRVRHAGGRPRSESYGVGKKCGKTGKTAEKLAKNAEKQAGSAEKGGKRRAF